MELNRMPVKSIASMFVAAGIVSGAGIATAAEWSDTSLSYSYGTKFREPFNPNDVQKDRVGLFHVSGYKYGTNLVAATFLMSDSKDAASGNAGVGAQEVYMVYRNTVEMGKATGSPVKFGWVKDVGVTFGFDANTKNNGYGSRKREFLIGPTFMMDVPGLLSISLLASKESQAPNGFVGRYTYKTYPTAEVAWGFPLGGSGFSFEGLALFIGSKGNDEFGAPTKAETNIMPKLMYDMSAITGSAKGTFKVGFEYQYWKNKFGNDSSGPAGSGAFARTPMIRAEYHF